MTAPVLKRVELIVFKVGVCTSGEAFVLCMQDPHHPRTCLSGLRPAFCTDRRLILLVKWRVSADTNFNLSVRFFGRWLQGVVGLSQFHLKVHAAVHEPISGSLHAVDEFQDLGDFFTINKVFFENDYSAHVRKL